MPETIDVTGISEPVVADIRRLVNTLRARPGEASAPPASPDETPDQWARRLTAWAAGHAARTIDLDDSRESVYAGRGE